MGWVVKATLPPGKRSGTHCMSGSVSFKTGLDGCENSCFHRDSIPRPSNP